jgi:hypothetical protein
MAYGKVSETYWHDRKIRALSHDGRFFMLYLLTCPHRNRIGLFPMDPYYAAGDMQWPLERVQAAIDELQEAGRIGWDPDVRVIFLPHWFAHNTLENANVAKGAKADLGVIPDTPFLHPLLEAASKAYRPHFEPFMERLRGRVANLLPTTPREPSPNRSGNSSGNSSANGSGNGSETQETQGVPNRSRNRLGNQPEQEQDKPAPSPAPSPSPEEQPLATSEGVGRGQQSPRRASRHEREVLPQDEANRLRDLDRSMILERLHLGSSTVTVNGKSVSMELEMHIRDKLAAEYGARAFSLALAKVRDVEEIPPDEPISLRLLESHPEVVSRALVAAALDDGPGPSLTQLGVKLKAIAPPTSANVLQAEAKLKLEEARRLA